MKKEKELLIKKFLFYDLHYGSSKLTMNLTSKSHLIGVRNGFCVLDLRETRLYLRYAINFLKRLLTSRKKILFLGGPLGLEKEFGSLCLKKKHPWVETWSYGLLTNPGQSYGDKSFFKYGKPSLIFIFDLSLYEEAIKEALRLDIPIMAFVNTDESLEIVDYPIPANVKSMMGGRFTYNFFFYLFQLYQKN